MKSTIGDEAAIAFATGFYKALGANHSIEKAYKFGRVEIGIEGIPEDSTPVLYSHKFEPFGESKAIWLVEFKATLEDLDQEQIESIMNSLRQITGDASLSLRRIDSGSVRFFLEGSDEAFKRLQSLVEEGKLEEISNLPIQKVDSSTKGEVVEAVTATQGQIRFMGGWWTAKVAKDVKINLQPGQFCRVIGRQGITLLVEPLDS